MMASDAVRAPSTPPLTGQSRKPTPSASSCACMSRAVPAPTVEQSITIMFGTQSRLEARDHGAHVLVGGHADHDGLAVAGEFRQAGEGDGSAVPRRAPRPCRRCDSTRPSADPRDEDCAPCARPWHPIRRNLFAYASSRLMNDQTRSLRLCAAGGKAHARTADSGSREIEASRWRCCRWRRCRASHSTRSESISSDVKYWRSPSSPVL